MVIEGRYQIFAGNEFVFFKNAVMGNVVFALLLHTRANTPFQVYNMEIRINFALLISPTQSTYNKLYMSMLKL